MLNIFLFNNFFRKKNSIFWENREKRFWGHIRQFFRERRFLASKIIITFFITNEVVNILLFNSFFKKSCIFWENRKKPFLGLKFIFTYSCRVYRNELNEYGVSSLWWIAYKVQLFVWSLDHRPLSQFLKEIVIENFLFAIASFTLSIMYALWGAFSHQLT